MALPKETQERIKADAERYTKDEGYQKVYIDGATTENDRAQVLVDALEQFISYHETGLLPARHVYEQAVAARKQWKSWKGKEVLTNNKTTMESKQLTTSYTKGEWYLQEYTDAYTNIVRCNNGKHETLFIASTPQSSLPEARANAKLMAAAPDLLEALQDIIAITERDHIAWAKAKAAIEKAIGNPAPDRPCPHCGKELNRDRNLCCRECGKEVEG